MTSDEGEPRPECVQGKRGTGEEEVREGGQEAGPELTPGAGAGVEVGSGRGRGRERFKGTSSTTGTGLRDTGTGGNRAGTGNSAGSDRDAEE